MTLPFDVARCRGITEVNAIKPINICTTCALWQSLGTGGPLTPHIAPAAAIRADENGWHMHCDYRIEG